MKSLLRHVTLGFEFNFSFHSPFMSLLYFKVFIEEFRAPPIWSRLRDFHAYRSDARRYGDRDLSNDQTRTLLRSMRQLDRGSDVLMKNRMMLLLQLEKIYLK